MIAASLSLAAAQLGLGGAGAGVLFFSILTTLGLAHLQFERIRDRLDLEEKIESLSEEFGGPQVRVHNEFEVLRAKVDRLDKSLTERVRLEFDPIARESEIFSRLVKDLAESLSEIENQIETLDDRIAAEAQRAAERAKLSTEAEIKSAPPVELPKAADDYPGETREPSVAPLVTEQEPSETPAQNVSNTPLPRLPKVPSSPPPIEPAPKKVPAPPVRTKAAKTSVEEVRGAIAAGRMEIHLQPIVALPQRRVAYYEAYSRLRTADGMILEPEDFMPIAEEHKLIAVLDSFVLHKVPEIFDHFDARRSDAGLFCNISAVSLLDHRVFERLKILRNKIERFENQLVLEFSQSQFKSMAAVEHETLNALKEMGFRYSLDKVYDLSANWSSYAAEGIDFVKIPSEVLLQDPEAVNLDIHLADLARLISRKGLNVVATHIEDEKEVVEILDQDIRFGQGYTFGQPRLLRLDSVLARSKRRNENADQRLERERSEQRNPEQARLRSTLRQSQLGARSVDRVIR